MVKNLIKVFRYSMKEEPTRGNSLIYSLKRDYRYDVIEFLSDQLCSAILHNYSLDNSFIVTSVPRRKESIIKYGYNHSEELARAVSKKLNIRYIRILQSKAKYAQKNLTKEQRFETANFTYIKKHPPNLKGMNVLIVDDIVTTGSSMAASAKLIKKLGAKKILGATIAIAYKDSYTPFVKG